MKIKIEMKKRTMTVKLFGELDHHSAEAARKKVEEFVMQKSCYNIIFDLSQLEFMDSSGIGLIMGRYRLVSPLGGKIYVVAGEGAIKRIIKMSGLGSLVKIFDDTEKAMKEACGGENI